jgi:hypothetical protein
VSGSGQRRQFEAHPTMSAYTPHNCAAVLIESELLTLRRIAVTAFGSTRWAPSRWLSRAAEMTQ